MAVLTSVLMGCTPVSTTEKARSDLHFLLGPPNGGDGQYHRVKVIVPGSLLDPAVSAGAESLRAVPQITFPIRYPTLAQVKREQLSENDVVLMTIAWEPPGAVRRRVDGSWLNYYSKYKVRLQDAYGLQAARGADRIDTSVLYTSPDLNTLIERHALLGEPATSCHLIANTIDYVAVELKFDAALLPQWRQVLSTTLSPIRFER